MAMKKIRFGELLVEKMVITEDDLSRALSYISKNGGRVGDALVALEIITENQLLGALRYHFGIPAVDLKRIRIQQNIIDLISKEIAVKHRAVPFKIKDKTLMVVMSNPMDLNAVEDIEFVSGFRIQPVLSKESEIAKALNYYYLGIKPEEKDDQPVEESTADDDILAEVDIIPGTPIDEQDEEAAEVSDEDLIHNEDPDAAPPPTPSREEAIAAEEAYLESNPAMEGSASTGTESFSLKEIVQIQDPAEEPDEPVLSLDEVEIDYEAAIEERRFLGDLIEELEDIDGLMHTAVMKQRRILKNLIILLVKKGIITTEEIQDFASSDITEESTH